MSSQPISFVEIPTPAAKRAIAAQAWPVDKVLELFNLPFNDLLFRAQQVHREHFDPLEVELATLLSIKTGGCPEDCGYCPQAARYDTGVQAQKLLELEQVLEAARAAKAHGATRFCMGAAWRGPAGPGDAAVLGERSRAQQCSRAPRLSRPSAHCVRPAQFRRFVARDSSRHQP